MINIANIPELLTISTAYCHQISTSKWGYRGLECPVGGQTHGVSLFFYPRSMVDGTQYLFHRFYGMCGTDFCDLCRVDRGGGGFIL